MKNLEKGLACLAYDPAWAEDREQNRMSGEAILGGPDMHGEGGTEDPEGTKGT